MTVLLLGYGRRDYCMGLLLTFVFRLSTKMPPRPSPRPWRSENHEKFVDMAVCG